LFITHDLSLGNYVSDRTVILRHGAIVEMGLTPKVFGNPRHDYTKMLLTAVPELHKKWAHTPMGPVAIPGDAALTGEQPLGEPSHAAAVIKRDSRAAYSRHDRGTAVASALLEPPELEEIEPGHLVAVPE
jgi:ABC-type dipeptide/oligopeptide/nickel transport system ATPase component